MCILAQALSDLSGIEYSQFTPSKGSSPEAGPVAILILIEFWAAPPRLSGAASWGDDLANVCDECSSNIYNRRTRARI